MSCNKLPGKIPRQVRFNAAAFLERCGVLKKSRHPLSKTRNKSGCLRIEKNDKMNETGE
jgi:hypothetical protein